MTIAVTAASTRTHMGREYSARSRRESGADEVTLGRLAPDDRPREKLERLGVSVLGDNELLAVIVGHGSQHRSALAVANDVLSTAGGLHALPQIHRGRLLRLAGIGRAQASRLQAAVELGRRTLLTPTAERPRFAHPRDLARYLAPQYGSHPVERFGVVLLDRKLRLLSVRVVSVGSIDTSLAHPREVFREALMASAAAVAVFHNHPSGDPTPSREDLAVTGRLRQAGVVLGIDLVDHVILADERYYSLKEAGLI
jgi:DNA repair protein RadC